MMKNDETEHDKNINKSRIRNVGFKVQIYLNLHSVTL